MESPRPTDRALHVDRAVGSDSDCRRRRSESATRAVVPKVNRLRMWCQQSANVADRALAWIWLRIWHSSSVSKVVRPAS